MASSPPCQGRILLTADALQTAGVVFGVAERLVAAHNLPLDPAADDELVDDEDPLHRLMSARITRTIWTPMVAPKIMPKNSAF